MKNSKGFSLIEIIIYMAILAVILVLVVNSLNILLKSFNNGRMLSNINHSAETAMERMTREIRLAYDIDADSSNFDSHPGRLALDTYDNLGATTTMDFYLNGGELMVLKGSGSPNSLTASGTAITNLIFRRIYASSTSKAIKIELEIQGVRGNYQKTESFYNTAILRGSY